MNMQVVINEKGRVADNRDTLKLFKDVYFKINFLYPVRLELHDGIHYIVVRKVNNRSELGYIESEVVDLMQLKLKKGEDNLFVNYREDLPYNDKYVSFYVTR